MSAWRRASVGDKCGGCGQQLTAGAPVLMLQPRGIQRRLLRCETCAGPAPPDLPERIETSAKPLAFERLGLVPLTFTRR